MKTRSYTLNDDQSERIGEIALKANVSDSHVVRVALEFGVDEAERRLCAVNAPMTTAPVSSPVEKHALPKKEGAR